jgi:hypothetical protein
MSHCALQNAILSCKEGYSVPDLLVKRNVHLPLKSATVTLHVIRSESGCAAARIAVHRCRGGDAETSTLAVNSDATTPVSRPQRADVQCSHCSGVPTMPGLSR